MSLAVAPLLPSSPRHLPGRQAEVLRALAGYQQRHGYPPALGELGRLVGIHGPSTVSQYLATLEHTGYVRRTPRLPGAVAVIRLPDVAEPLQAAAPADAGGDTLR